MQVFDGSDLITKVDEGVFHFRPLTPRVEGFAPINVKIKKGKFAFTTQDGRLYANGFDVTTNDMPFEIPQVHEGVLAVIPDCNPAFAKFAADAKESRATLRNVCIDEENIVATMGHMLLVQKHGLVIDKPFLVPAKAWGAGVLIQTSETQAVICNGAERTITRLENYDSYPAYRRVIPALESITKTFTINRTERLAWLKANASLLLRNNQKRPYFALEENGELYDAKYFQTILETATSDEIECRFWEESRPLTMVSGDLTFVLMPMRGT